MTYLCSTFSDGTVLRSRGPVVHIGLHCVRVFWSARCNNAQNPYAKSKKDFSWKSRVIKYFQLHLFNCSHSNCFHENDTFIEVPFERRAHFYCHLNYYFDFQTLTFSLIDTVCMNEDKNNNQQRRITHDMNCWLALSYHRVVNFVIIIFEIIFITLFSICIWH